MNIVEYISDPSLLLLIASRARSYTLWRMLEDSGLKTGRRTALDEMKNETRSFERFGLAVKHDFMDIVSHFLTLGYGHAHLFYTAVRTNNLKIVKEFFDKDIIIKTASLDDVVSVEMAKYLISKGEKIGVNTPHHFVKTGNTELIDFILRLKRYDQFDIEEWLEYATHRDMITYLQGRMKNKTLILALETDNLDYVVRLMKNTGLSNLDDYSEYIIEGGRVYGRFAVEKWKS